MKPAEDLEAFLAAPIGRCAIGEDLLFWCWSPTLCGSAHWTRPDPADLAQIRRFHALLRSSAVRPPIDLVIDAGSLDLGELVASGRHIRRLALIGDGGMADAAEALAWLDRADAAAAALDLACLIADLAAARPMVRRLRAMLGRRCGDLEPRDAARALGLSSLELRRALEAAGTSFSREREAAQVRAAHVLLETSDAHVESVAYAVGCQSRFAFARMFRRHTGVTPAQHRAARRG